jgi:DNA-binding NtrC family response regulator
MSSAIKSPPLIDDLQAFRLLVVSKESSVIRPLSALAENGRWQVEVASSGWDAMERLESGAAPELMLLDLPRGDGDSFPMLRWLRRLSPQLPVIAICDAEDTAVRQEALRLGAESILSRPLDMRQLQLLLRDYGDGGEMESAEMIREHVERLDADEFFVTASPAMQKLRAQAELLAQSDVPVLIVGERGSGKASVARLIHKLSPWSGFRFQRINSESWMGGGQASGLSGNVELSERGTVFFSEITAMPESLQARLLATLASVEAAKNAGPHPGREQATVRILSATSENLERSLGERRLSADLYRRLSAFTLQVPPLRQRKEEIPVLLNYAMRKLSSRYGLVAREFSPSLLADCQQYDWPGNVAELENYAKRHLAEDTPELLGSRGASSSVAGSSAALTGENSKPSPNANGAGKPQPSLKSMIQDIKSEAERKVIGAALERTGWNRKAAARLLRVSYRTLLYKIEQYQMKAVEPFFSVNPVEMLTGENGGKPDGKAS